MYVLEKEVSKIKREWVDGRCAGPPYLQYANDARGMMTEAGKARMNTGTMDARLTLRTRMTLGGEEAWGRLRAAASAVEVAAEVAGAACLVAMSRAEPGEAERPQRASDLRQEERRRRREEAQAAQAQSEKKARVSEEVHLAL